MLHLDQERGALKYDDPTNARWDNSGIDSETALLFYPEVLVPRDTDPLISPAVLSLQNLRNVHEFQHDEEGRRTNKKTHWPILQRSYVHFENGNVELLKQECVNLTGMTPDLHSQENRAEWIVRASRALFDNFLPSPNRAQKTKKLCDQAGDKARAEVAQLAQTYVDTGRMAALWKEVKSVRSQFLVNYETLAPILMLKRYWKSHLQILDKYLLSVKDFEGLRSFYVDCVESSCKLLVIGLAMARIAQTGKPSLPTRKGERDIWWFEQLKNGLKEDHLRDPPTLRQIIEPLDLKLRNGVGHHAAHYEANSDEIVYVVADDSALRQVRMSYTTFVSTVFHAYCAFELAIIFFERFLIAGGGRLGPV